MAERSLTAGIICISIPLASHIDHYDEVLDAYRMKLRGHLPGLDGDELARRRVEEFANKIRPAGFLVRGVPPDPITRLTSPFDRTQ